MKRPLRYLVCLCAAAFALTLTSSALARRSALGESCTKTPDCMEQLRCMEETCVKLAGQGRECGKTADCTTGLSCVGNVCLALPGVPDEPPPEPEGSSKDNTVPIVLLSVGGAALVAGIVVMVLGGGDNAEKQKNLDRYDACFDKLTGDELCAPLETGRLEAEVFFFEDEAKVKFIGGGVALGVGVALAVAGAVLMAMPADDAPNVSVGPWVREREVIGMRAAFTF